MLNAVLPALDFLHFRAAIDRANQLSVWPAIIRYYFRAAILPSNKDLRNSFCCFAKTSFSSKMHTYQDFEAIRIVDLGCLSIRWLRVRVPSASLLRNSS